MFLMGGDKLFDKIHEEADRVIYEQAKIHFNFILLPQKKNHEPT